MYVGIYLEDPQNTYWVPGTAVQILAHVILITTIWGSIDFDPHLTDEGIEAQRAWVTCLMSHSQQVAEQALTHLAG